MNGHEKLIPGLQRACRNRQAGAITMFSAVLILILLTEMIIYAVQTGVFEQRKSSNEMRNKLAFHAADSGIQLGKQFITANAKQVSSASASVGGRAGWFSGGGLRWQPCEDVDVSADPAHPCNGEPVEALRNNSYFYSFDGSIELPVDRDAIAGDPNERVVTHALMCMLDIDRALAPPVQGCTDSAGEHDSRYFVITLMARGRADCDANGANCTAEALVTEKIASYGPGGNEGGPGAPLTARTNVPVSGTVEIVPNPNGGGVGVPVSSWVNARTDSCGLGGEEPISPQSGSYATCEAHEWYGVGDFPADYACPTNSCSCNKNEDRLLSFAQGNERTLGIDIVEDPNFPCDLWDYMFGIAKTDYEKVLAMVPPANRLTDCDSLDENSTGLYWVSGEECDLQTQVGTAEEPVFLILAVEDVKANAQAEIFGALFVTDVLHPGQTEFSGIGTATVYGAVVMDAVMEHFQGTFQIVYVENILDQVLEDGAFGAIAGGWTDFHATWR